MRTRREAVVFGRSKERTEDQVRGESKAVDTEVRARDEEVREKRAQVERLSRQLERQESPAAATAVQLATEIRAATLAQREAEGDLRTAIAARATLERELALFESNHRTLDALGMQLPVVAVPDWRQDVALQELLAREAALEAEMNRVGQGERRLSAKLAEAEQARLNARVAEAVGDGPATDTAKTAKACVSLRSEQAALQDDRATFGRALAIQRQRREARERELQAGHRATVHAAYRRQVAAFVPLVKQLAAAHVALEDLAEAGKIGSDTLTCTWPLPLGDLLVRREDAPLRLWLAAAKTLLEG
jgi:hypothetical protein